MLTEAQQMIPTISSRLNALQEYRRDTTTPLDPSEEQLTATKQDAGAVDGILERRVI